MQGNLNMMPGHCVILTLFAFGEPFYKLFANSENRAEMHFIRVYTF